MSEYTKVDGEDNIFYDAKKNEYRYRMHCPNCGKVTGCMCFNTLKKAKEIEDEELSYTCSSKCSLICFVKNSGDINIIHYLCKLKVLTIKDKILLYITYMGFWERDYPGLYINMCRWITRLLCKIGTSMKCIDLEKLVERLTEEQARYVLDELDPDFDFPEGELCDN